MTPEQAQALRDLLARQPVAALATLHDGEPAVSMVPWVLLPDGRFVIHVSALASHTADMRSNPEVALLITAPLAAGESPLALPRLSVRGRAEVCPVGSPGHDDARAAYLARLPESAELFSFGDFSLFVISVLSARFVGGFAQARSLTAAGFADIVAGRA
ncbi:HugZ family protein [Methyloversatilis discipulorum]|uniref:HugZ family pyridoxamine 5'-phosphate oxidase n=1 Tax=Methyloversatilis discipulorum TaxID=1119528 RepID=UPI001A439CEE|nr:pyridoxamine 5'-phosphate oxidase family protein [Methyloversatilis discipulorum]MBL8466446.1 pyridoxamine 5'-phosphate oxidase family protein [Methyloversatilis discipulorum]